MNTSITVSVPFFLKVRKPMVWKFLWFRKRAAFFVSIFLFILQSSIGVLFRSMHQLKKHQEVLKLTCGLMTHPEELIEQVCEFLSNHMHQVDISGEVDDRLLRCCDFIESLCKELPQLDVTDASYCKAVAFFGRNASFVFIPQRINECFVALLATPLMRNEIECAVVVNKVNDFNETVLDKVRENIERNNEIVIASLLVLRDDNGDSERVHLGRLINSVRLFKDPEIFVMQNCYIPPSVSPCIAQQLGTCKEMQFVCLNNVRNLSAVIAVALVKCNAENLEGLQIEQSELVEDRYVWDDFTEVFGNSLSLKYLSFAQTNTFLLNMDWIEEGCSEVDFSNCSLSISKAKHCWLTSCDRYVLSLAGNSLTNSFDNWILSSFSVLKSLSLNDTQLSAEDVRVIGRSLRETHLQLRRLFISFNTLTDCVAGLIPVGEQLENLEVLWMQRTSLSREDIRHLGLAVVSGSLPRLSSIDLSNNGLFTIEGDLENLILACTARYRRQRMTIYLKDNYLSEDFLSRIETICQGTNVVPNLEMPDVKLLGSVVQSTSLMRL